MTALTVLPTHAGPVPLRFSTQTMLPRRVPQGDAFEILLPRLEGMKYYSLADGTQFLVSYPVHHQLVARGHHAKTYFFGGMDEAAFITSLDHVPAEAMKSDGEEGFYASITPREIRWLQHEFPSGTTRRQGDIWSFQLPMTWSQLGQSSVPTLTKGLPRRERRKKMALYRKLNNLGPSKLPGVRKVLNTEHTLTGYWATLQRIKTGRLVFGQTLVVEGALEAADHAPQELRGGPHILARTPHILSAPHGGVVWD